MPSLHIDHFNRSCFTTNMDSHPRLSLEECQQSHDDVEDFYFAPVTFSEASSRYANRESFYFTSGSMESTNSLFRSEELFMTQANESMSSMNKTCEASFSRLLRRNEGGLDMNESLPFIADYITDNDEESSDEENVKPATRCNSNPSEALLKNCKASFKFETDGAGIEQPLRQFVARKA